MKKIKDFYQLEAWKKGHSYALEIYKLAKAFPKSERFGLTSQIQRAAASITANIAEGFGRYHFADKVRFYYQARGSVKEVQNFLLFAKDMGYVSSCKIENIWGVGKEVEKLINGLIRSIEKNKE